jgi:hypothetical protein
MRNFRIQSATATNLSCALGLNFESKLRSGTLKNVFQQTARVSDPRVSPAHGACRAFAPCVTVRAASGSIIGFGALRNHRHRRIAPENSGS